MECTEETILDFFVVCDLVIPLVSSKKIDSRGDIALTRFKGKVVQRKTT